jgi:hypothetical protein
MIFVASPRDPGEGQEREGERAARLVIALMH